MMLDAHMHVFGILLGLARVHRVSDGSQESLVQPRPHGLMEPA